MTTKGTDMAGEGLNITLDSEAIRKMVTESVLAQIEPEQQRAIIQSAVSQMLTAQPDGYSGRKTPSPLQQAFSNAVNGYCHEIAREWLKQPEVEAQVREACLNALGGLLTGPNASWRIDEVLGGALAGAIKQSFEKDSY